MWYQKISTWVAGCLLLLLFTACHNYYKARTLRTGESAASSLDSLKTYNRFFVLRSGGQAYFMNNLRVSENRKTLTATLDTLPANHRLHVVYERSGNKRYKPGDPNEQPVLSEVHLYAPSVASAMGQEVTLPLDAVQKIEVIEHDNKRTTNSYMIGAIGAVTGAFIVAAFIALATKSSCPFVSAHDGTAFQLQGEIYGGAIYPQMARHDYLPLKMAPLADGTLQLKISNELKEVQYTDIANLQVIQHDPSVHVLTNETGQLYSIRSPQAPLSALLNNRKDVVPALRLEADNTVAYMDDTTTTDASNHIEMAFGNEAGKTKAKLVLTLKNSYFLDQLYGELAYGFGKYYPKYIKKQGKKPVHELVQWTREQQIPLTVSVQRNEGWKKVAELTTIGPLANRRVVVPIDLAGAGKNKVNIRISGGFMFWEVDYAGLDFSADDAYTVEKLMPVAATDEGGRDVLNTLQKEDGLYLEQPEIGNVATLVYKPSKPQDPAKSYTYILHTKGYYQHIRHFTNKPDIGFLKQFKNPNAFPQYGKIRYQQVEKESLRLMAVQHK